ncbi:MAG: NAD(P)H-binding protein [Thermomicrobiales bacterium]
MITVMGASGNTGSKIASALLAHGVGVRALGRTEQRLATLRNQGAEVRTGEILDGEYLTEAFRGAEAVYTLLPTDQRAADYRARQDAEGEAIARAIRASGVSHVVALSCVGADGGENMGVIDGLHAQEERLKRIAGVNLLFLRPVSFYENLYATLGLIKQQGMTADSVEPDLPVPMVATRDIAAVAVDALTRRDWSGASNREILGPREVTHREIATILGQCLDLPDLAYVRLSDVEMVSALTGAGLSPSFAGLYVEMTRAFNDGRVKPLSGRTSDNTTATRFEDFAGELATAYRAM